MGRRAELCCALLDFHPTKWTGPIDTPLVQMGGEPDIAGGHQPYESFEDGCPGSWYRCGFIRSLLRYQRTAFESGMSENIHLSRSHDALVHSAIRYLEAEGMRARRHAIELCEV